MTDTQDLLRLADEVAAATGPDRALDEAILIAIGGKKKSADWWLGFAYIGRVIPAYTASLDAAMTLVPEGWRIWTADFSIEGRFVWMLCGPKLTWITHEDGSREGGDDWYQSGVAATPALALCAAALKARAHSTKESDNG